MAWKRRLVVAALIGGIVAMLLVWRRRRQPHAIVEGESVDAILSAAATQGHRYCLVLAPGLLIRESWRGDAEAGQEFHSALAHWIDENEFLVAGRIPDGGADSYGLDERCLLVDLDPQAHSTIGIGLDVFELTLKDFFERHPGLPLRDVIQAAPAVSGGSDCGCGS